MTKLGSFGEELVTNFVAKIAQIFGHLLGCIEKCYPIKLNLLLLNVYDTFGKNEQFLFHNLVTLFSGLLCNV